MDPGGADGEAHVRVHHHSCAGLTHHQVSAYACTRLQGPSTPTTTTVPYTLALPESSALASSGPESAQWVPRAGVTGELPSMNAAVPPAWLVTLVAWLPSDPVPHIISSVPLSQLSGLHVLPEATDHSDRKGTRGGGVFRGPTL